MTDREPTPVADRPSLTAADSHTGYARLGQDSKWLLGGYRYLVPIAIVFTAGGIWFGVTQFPEIAVWRMIVGGTLFGLFSTGCVAGARMF